MSKDREGRNHPYPLSEPAHEMCGDCGLEFIMYDSLTDCPECALKTPACNVCVGTMDNDPLGCSGCHEGSNFKESDMENADQFQNALDEQDNHLRAVSRKVDVLVRQLIEGGWNEWPNRFDKPARSFFKRFETETRCHCNDGKWGMQVKILVYPDSGNYEMKVSGQLQDETWIEFHQWVMPEKIEDGIALIPRMLKSWECMANVHVQPDAAEQGQAGAAG